MGKSDKKDKNIKNTAEEAKDMQESVAEGSAESMSAITSDMANEATDNDLISGENAPMVLAENLVKIYKTSELEVLALQGLDLRVERGELTAIIGNSGSGKSTFLNMLGGLDEPSAGKLFVDGKNLFKLTAKEKVLYKRDTVGFVWQNNGRNLLPFMNAMENIMTPMHLTSEKNKKERALELLDLVGMSHRKFSRMNQLSGGEQQRIAIAIALANRPKLLLADEPTGSVDQKTSNQLLEVFNKLNKELGTTIVIVTHDINLANKVDRVIMIKDGKTSSERVVRTSAAGSDVKEHDEFMILDRVGRLQLPREMLTAAGITGNQVRVELEGNKIVITAP